MSTKKFNRHGDVTDQDSFGMIYVCEESFVIVIFLHQHKTVSANKNNFAISGILLSFIRINLLTYLFFMY